MRTAKFWVVAAAILGLVGAINPGVASSARPPVQPPPPLLPLGTPTGQSGPSPSIATAGPNKAANTYLYRDYPGGHNYIQMYSTLNVESVTSHNNGTVFPGRFFAYSFFFQGVSGSVGQGYIGLQTRLNNCATGANQGFGVVFSIFGATGASINGGVSNQVCSGVENGQSYYSLHWPFIFGNHHDYTVIVARNDATHYDGFVVDTGTYYYLGRITVPSGWSYLSNTQNVQWTENYPNYQTWNGCNFIDKSVVVFRRPWAYDGVNNYYSNFPDATYIQDDGGASFCTGQSSISGDLGNDARREQVGTY